MSATEYTTAVQVVGVNRQGNTLFPDTSIIEEILNKPNVRDRNLVVISITGAIRKGKSFMLNFFIRYLKTMGSGSDWLGNENDPLTGFSWRGGSERNTIGVLIWPEVFLYDYPNGKKVAILLMDTQGMFDSRTTFDGSVSIFALSTMLSSVQIYNISNNIQEDHLQYLSLFSEYGKLALQDPLNKPFQKLLFLVRDWFFPYEASYGKSGGAKILRRAFAIKDTDDAETQELRVNIMACFDEIDCFLMPYPGTNVATNPNFNGSYSDIEADFITQLRELVPSILSPEKLITKTVNGLEIRAQDFVFYLKAYLRVLTGNTLPTPKSILSATADAQNIAAISDAKEQYTRSMDRQFNVSSNYLDFEQMSNVNRTTSAAAKQIYLEAPKVQGTDKPQEDYERELDEALQKRFYYYLIKNERKRPDMTPKIVELIDTITKEKQISEDLNAANTKLILDLINTMNQSTQDYRQQVDELIQSFNKNKQEGFNLVDALKEIGKILPHIISIVALFF